MDDAPQLKLDIPPEYGRAGFGDLSVREDVAKFVAAKICRTTIGQPVSGRELCRLVEEYFFVRITTVAIRAVVSHCRVNLRFPIGSNGKGYYLALTPDELQGTLRHLHRRIVHMQAAYSEMERVQRWMAERQRRFIGLGLAEYVIGHCEKVLGRIGDRIREGKSA